jgi:hypothetical protein
MSGIWDRIRNRGENDRPVSSLALWSAVYLVGRGVFSAQQAQAALNRDLGNQPLSGDEITDLQNILTQAQSGTATAKLDYMLRLQALVLLAEVGTLDSETAFRTQLGI